jgi:hypothetical protein
MTTTSGVIKYRYCMRHAIIHIAAFAGFIALQYVSLESTTFISLDPSAGVCSSVAKSISSTYTMDKNGYW